MDQAIGEVKPIADKAVDKVEQAGPVWWKPFLSFGTEISAASD